MHDLVIDSGCGLAMWQKPIDEVAKELHDKLHDKNWLNDAGASAKKLAENSFSRDVLASQLMSVLEAAVAGKAHECQSIAPGKYVS